MKGKTLKVALLQESDRGSRDANLDAIEAGLREAAAAGARLVLLQELGRAVVSDAADEAAIAAAIEVRT